jgi:hypothetical protein
MLAIFLKPLILRTRRARKIKGLRKMAKVLLFWEGAAKRRPFQKRITG